MNSPTCRLCGAQLNEIFVDLGMAPLANALVRPENARMMERFYPLRALVCAQCFLVQLDASIPPEQIFTHYPYFSSVSDTWLDHCARYVSHVVPRFRLGADSHVVEVGSNDGHLLKLFKRKGVSVFGVEPAANIARVATEHGIPTEIAFFGRKTAHRLRSNHVADLIIANNVLAHVPDINDFVAGLKVLLRPGGTITVEFPHLLRLIEGRQFDTIYHEHVSYLSLLAVEAAFARQGLLIFDVETIPTHGGSLRVYASHDTDNRALERGLIAVRNSERAAALDRIETYRRFDSDVVMAKCDILDFFVSARRAGKQVVGYSAAAKGISLLNYCGIGAGFIDYVVDRSPYKQDLLLPGTHLPVYGPARVFATRPDYLFVLAWNIRDEVMQQMADIRSWGGRFVIPVPQVAIV